jgi:hypothetical protein
LLRYMSGFIENPSAWGLFYMALSVYITKSCGKG